MNTIFRINALVFVEYLDYMLFLYLSRQISLTLLPAADPTKSLISTLGIFALSYLVRPFGSIVFCWLSDRVSRKGALLISCSLMGFSTVGMACIPSYAAIGSLAPILFTTFRVLQSFAISGELSNAATFAIENTPHDPRLAASFSAAAASAGAVAGCLLAALASTLEFPEIWRAFLFATGLLPIACLALRRQLSGKHPKTTRNNAVFGLGRVWRTFCCFTLASLLIAAFYTFSGFSMTYLISRGVIGSTSGLLINALVQLAITFLIPYFALVLRKRPTEQLIQYGLILISSSAFLIFPNLADSSLSQLALGYILFIIGDSLLSAVVLGFLYDWSPRGAKALGSGLAWAMATSIFGGSAPLLAGILLEQGRVWVLPIAYSAASIAFFAGYRATLRAKMFRKSDSVPVEYTGGTDSRLPHAYSP